MLVRSRRRDKDVTLGPDGCLVVLRSPAGGVNLGIETPPQIALPHHEVYAKVDGQNRLAVMAGTMPVDAVHFLNNPDVPTATLPLPGTPPAPPSRKDQVRGRLHTAAETLRDALQGPWQRERQRIQAEFGAQGLLPLLMKARNGARWTCDERLQLRHHLRRMVSLSPYVIVLLAPGSMVLLPVVAWWLDRRRLLRAHSRLNKTPPTHP